MKIVRKTALIFALTTVAVPALFVAATPAVANVQQYSDNAYVNSAQNHYDNGRIREATIELKNALRQDPNNGAARYLLGKVLLENGDLIGAEKELSRAHYLAPTDDSAVLLANTKLQSGDPMGALELVQGQGTSIETTVQRITIRGSALTSLKRYDEAERAYQEILSLDPQRVEGHLGLGQVYIARGDLSSAAQKLDEIVVGMPDFSPGWMLRGEIAFASGDKQTAFVAFDRAVSLAPNTIPPLIARARALLSSGDIERARADTNTVANIAPNAPITHYLRSAISFAAGDIDSANRSFTQLQRNFNNFAPAILLGALIKHQRGDYNQADSLLTRYITMEPNNSEARRALAKVRLDNDQPRNAITTLESVLRGMPNDTKSLRQLASAYLSIDDFTKAEATFRRIVEIGSTEDVRQAQTALSLLDPSDNIDDPAFKDKRTRLTLLKAIDSAVNGDPKRADRYLVNVGATHANSPTVLSIRGSIAMQLGDPDRARAYLSQALVIEPELTSAIGAFEQLDQVEGTTDRILPRLQKLLQARPKSELLTLGIARQLEATGQNNRVAEFLAQRAAVIPQSTNVSRMLISANMVLERLPEAANEAQRLASIDPTDQTTQLFAANALIDAREPGRAIHIIKNLRKMVPDSKRAYSLLAEAQGMAGDIKSARATLTTARERWPDDLGIASALVQIEISQQNAQGIKEATDRLAKTNPTAAARLRARALSQMGQPGLAVQVLETAFARKADGRLAVDLYVQRRRAGRDDVAFAQLGQWVGRNLSDGPALMAYATGLLEVGRNDESAAAYKAYLALEPNNPIALNNYAWLRHQGNLPDALDYAERAYNAASGSPDIADTYGWMLVSYGKLKEGLALLKNATDAAPNSPGINYHFAYALSKAGRRDEAKAILVRVLERGEQFDKRTEAEQLMKNLNEG